MSETEKRVLNVASDLKGMAVLTPEAAERLGEVADVIVHPTEGKVLGIIWRGHEGQAGTLATSDFLIKPGGVMTATEAVTDLESLRRMLPGGALALSEIVGASVLTNEGRLLGQVSDVYVSVERPHAIYRVVESVWQRLFKGGFFIGGDVPQAYSRAGWRLIVPSDTPQRLAVTSLAEAA